MNRSPMPARTTPLRRTQPLPRGGRERAAAMRRTVARSRARRDTVPAPVREALFQRAERRCEVCRDQLRLAGWNAHHRKPRGMGGSLAPDRHSLSNLLAVCGTGTSGCHGQIEAHRAWAYSMGLLVRRTDDPAVVPVRLYVSARGWGWWYLTVDGRYAAAGER